MIIEHQPHRRFLLLAITLKNTWVGTQEGVNVSFLPPRTLGRSTKLLDSNRTGVLIIRRVIGHSKVDLAKAAFCDVVLDGDLTSGS